MNASEEIVLVGELPVSEDASDLSVLNACSELRCVLQAIVREYRIDLIHAISFNLIDTVSGIAAAGTPAVVAVRGMDVQRGIAMLRMGDATMQNDHVSLQCPSLELAERCRLFELSNDIVFVPNGFDPPLEAGLGDIHDGIRIVVPGNVGLERELPLLLLALDAVLAPEDEVLLADLAGCLSTMHGYTLLHAIEGLASESSRRGLLNGRKCARRCVGQISPYARLAAKAAKHRF